MSCRCNERRILIAQGVLDVARGDVKQAAEQARFVVASTIEDASSLSRAKVATAASKLGRALMLELKYDLSSLKHISNALLAAGEQMPLVLNRAINHTGEEALTQMRNVLVGQTGLSAAR
jgi:hypothetical protein